MSIQPAVQNASLWIAERLEAIHTYTHTISHRDRGQGCRGSGRIQISTPTSCCQCRKEEVLRIWNYDLWGLGYCYFIVSAIEDIQSVYRLGCFFFKVGWRRSKRGQPTGSIVKVTQNKLRYFKAASAVLLLRIAIDKWEYIWFQEP